MGERARSNPPGRRPPPPHWQGSSIRQQVKNLLSGLHGLHRMEKEHTWAWGRRPGGDERPSARGGSGF